MALLDARSDPAERWVRSVAAKANALVDWHYSGGIAQVLHLGDADSRARVMDAIRELASTLEGKILRADFRSEDSGLYREGVSQAPPGAIASFYEGGKSSTYMVKE